MIYTIKAAVEGWSGADVVVKKASGNAYKLRKVQSLEVSLPRLFGVRSDRSEQSLFSVEQFPGTFS